MGALLELENVYADIGQFHILQGVSMTVPENSVTVILGRNGAGKTTTLRTIMGYVHARSGAIRFLGQSITSLPTHQIVRAGMSYLPEEGHVFANLTVEENLLLATSRRDKRVQEKLEKVFTVFPDLKDALRRHAGTLSGGQKQMLGMGCLLLSDSPLMLIDEPSKGLSPKMVEKLVEVIRMLRTSTTVLLVEQNFYLASQVGDSFTIIDDGQTVLRGTMSEFVQSEELQQRYLGLHVAEGGW
ncbi:ABC transporter ATP-binding protein [Alicyclobacillus dauci]|uniref:ABC transporter ATP-binding protein n=1 Tax=Alicyclobacillus dauci TaxID=1475485 RepID=A0ABY6YZW2_9BACL|nr:ABC transporter ATP-binding protein [Alicyclobacillus dauci]WAH36173.1 ABC transporter ATP-binding protein [Alicyclobacillus dauci]